MIKKATSVNRHIFIMNNLCEIYDCLAGLKYGNFLKSLSSQFYNFSNEKYSCFYIYQERINVTMRFDSWPKNCVKQGKSLKK